MGKASKRALLGFGGVIAMFVGIILVPGLIVIVLLPPGLLAEGVWFVAVVALLVLLSPMAAGFRAGVMSAFVRAKKGDLGTVSGIGVVPGASTTPRAKRAEKEGAGLGSPAWWGTGDGAAGTLPELPGRGPRMSKVH